MSGDDFTAVYLLDDLLEPELVLPTSGEVFMSPASRQFAHVENGAVWVFDIDDGSHTQVSQDATVADTPLAIEWSPTGEALMYRVQSGNDEAVYVVRPDGSDHVLLAEFGAQGRSVWGKANAAAALGREVAGGALAKVRTIDMDAATPQPIEVDAVAGVDETSSRPIARCADGFLAEIGDASGRDLYKVSPDGGATAITNDGMGGVPVGCADDSDVSVYARSLLLLASFGGSVDPFPISGAEGYSGDGAFIMEPAGQPPLVFYGSMSLRGWLRQLADPADGVEVLDRPFNVELVSQIFQGRGEDDLDDFYSAITGEFMESQVHMGGPALQPATQVYSTEEGEFVLETLRMAYDNDPAPTPEDSLLLMITGHSEMGDRLRAVRGDGQLEGEGGVLLGSATQNVIQCARSALNFAVCLTENADGIGVSVLDEFYTQDGGRGPVNIRSEQLSDETEPFAFSVAACPPAP